MTTLNPRGIQQFCDALERCCGLHYSPEKDYLFTARLQEVIESHRCRDYLDLAGLLCGDEQTRRAIIGALVTSETSFFRDPETFEALPQLAAFAPGRPSPLVVWSLGCAAGQEVYSLLMRADETGLLSRGPWRLIGADISPRALARAREGRYSGFEVQRGLSEARRTRYMQPVQDDWQMAPSWRALPEWIELNLLTGLASLPAPQLVFCRNVLIYFSNAVKRRLVADILRALPEHGALVLGRGESSLAFGDLVAPDPQLPWVLRRRG